MEGEPCWRFFFCLDSKQNKGKFNSARPALEGAKGSTRKLIIDNYTINLLETKS